MALSLVGVCPDCAANVTAPLLNGPDAFQIRHFVEPRVERDSCMQLAIAASRVPGCGRARGGVFVGHRGPWRP
jgi:hypothetical protein